ncbi:MAG TPA: TRAP transporter substrate-binding protein [Xanthobacteraceae bacterium]|nr:TRAP transporter substrate-binding protein [Xanthobacteraceae bacterium]
MRVARRTVLASALASLAAPGVLRLAQADAPPTVLKLHHAFSAVSSVHDKFLAPWARKVESESGGRLHIDLFPSMELGGAPAQLFDQARGGDADIVWAVPGLNPGRFPKIETFELPFLPSSRALVSSKALQDFSALYLKDEFDEIHPLCFSCADRSVIHAYGPVRSIEDTKNLKLHVQTRLAGEAMRVLGALPVPMPGEELPAALTAGVVDGCVDPWHMVPTFRLNDVLKNHTEFSDLSLSSRTYVLAMNKAAYEQLPRDLQMVLDGNSGQVAAGMAGAMWDLQARAVADNVAQTGDVIVTLLPEAVAHWRKATEPVVEAWLKEMKEHKVDGGKMIASAHVLLAKYANLPEPQPPQPAPPQQSSNQAPPRSAGVTTVSSPAAPAPAPPAVGVKPAPPQPSHITSAPLPSAPVKPTPVPPAAKPALAHPITKPAPVPSAALQAPPPAAKPMPTVSAAPVVKPPPPTVATPMPPPAATPPPPSKALNIPF